MLKSNVPCEAKRKELTAQASLLRVLLRVFRAAKIAAMSDSLGNRMFRELHAGDLLFLRLAVEEAEPWVNKEVDD